MTLKGGGPCSYKTQLGTNIALISYGVALMPTDRPNALSIDQIYNMQKDVAVSGKAELDAPGVGSQAFIMNIPQATIWVISSNRKYLYSVNVFPVIIKAKFDQEAVNSEIINVAKALDVKLNQY